MIVCTDRTAFAERVLPGELQWRRADIDTIDRELAVIAGRIFGQSDIFCCEINSFHEFHHLLIVEYAEKSQYDLTVTLCKENIDLPHGVLCFAGSGKSFHGQRNRVWNSPPGNIYLTAFFAPGREIDHFGPGFIILPAVSVIDTIDSIPGLEGQASTKWVNDILIDGAKVAGVLTYTSAMGSDVTGVVLGIGLNVETKPRISPDPFAPKAASLSDYAKDTGLCNLKIVLGSLIDHLSRNYRLLTDNRYADLLDVYRRRSAVIGEEVTICTDDVDSGSEVVASGVVEAIGENLELHLKGRSKPITRGRLILRL
jgi:BirA family biotin operon repressor/biotin-[acetyl-CoA-carboxylase] ligase